MRRPFSGLLRGKDEVGTFEGIAEGVRPASLLFAARISGIAWLFKKPTRLQLRDRGSGRADGTEPTDGIRALAGMVNASSSGSDEGISGSERSSIDGYRKSGRSRGAREGEPLRRTGEGPAQWVLSSATRLSPEVAPPKFPKS
jgi:hypothetical protein